jgi:gingipain R
LKRNVNPDSVPYEFSEVYNQDQFYPGNLANMAEPYILRNTRGVNIALFPYQYNPVQKKLRIYDDLKIRITTNPQVQGLNEIHQNQTVRVAPFQTIYEQQYLNPFDEPQYTTVGDAGSMLIVTDESFVDVLLPLMRWKNQSGIKTQIVTTAETGSADTQIKTFIEDYYSTHPDLVYILLVGDSDKVPSHTYGYNGEQLWSDSYYGQIDGGPNDFHPELLVGRFSGNAEEIETMVNRTLEYEKTPKEGNWMKNAIGIGSNEGEGYGNDGEADYQHIRNIRTQLVDFGYETVYEFYQGSQGGEDQPGEPTATMINNAMDWGTGLFNYTGHGWLEGMYTGYYTNADVANMNNHGKYPFVISVACNNGTFVGETTLGEVFMRAKNNGLITGSIGFAGSSILMSWAPPMATQDEMTNILTEVYDNYRSTTLGGLFYNGQIGMLDEYNSDGTSKEVMQTWILFGDPSAVFRYDTTQEITAEHADMISAAATSFAVLNCNAEGGVATLSQGDEILGKGNILDGAVNLELNQPIDMEGELPVLTIVKQNFAPYQAEIEMSVMNVDDSNLNQISVYPNPATNFVHIQNKNKEQILKIEIRDLSGRMIENIKPNENQNGYQLNVSNYPAGTYLISVHLNNKTITKKLLIN